MSSELHISLKTLLWGKLINKTFLLWIHSTKLLIFLWVWQLVTPTFTTFTQLAPDSLFHASPCLHPSPTSSPCLPASHSSPAHIVSHPICDLHAFLKVATGHDSSADARGSCARWALLPPASFKAPLGSKTTLKCPLSISFSEVKAP